MQRCIENLNQYNCKVTKKSQGNKIVLLHVNHAFIQNLVSAEASQGNTQYCLHDKTLKHHIWQNNLNRCQN